MIPQGKKYFVIVVHYEGVGATNTLVTTLLAGSRPPEKIIVIDHGEEPLSLPSADPRLQLIRPQENSGYGAGINIGLGALLAHDPGWQDVVVGCNNDVGVGWQTLAQVADWCHDHPEPALAGVKAGRINLLTGRAKIVPNFQFSIGNFHLLPYIHGAFFFAPYGVLMGAAGLPTNYFLYWEDVLLSRRLARQNIPLRLAGGVEVEHDDRPARGMTDRKLYYLVRNGALFLQRETSLPWRLGWWLVNKLRLGWHRGIVRRALWDAAQGKTGKMAP